MRQLDRIEKDELIEDLERYQDGKHASFMPDIGNDYLEALNSNQVSYLLIKLDQGRQENLAASGLTLEEIPTLSFEEEEKLYNPKESLKAYREAMEGYNPEKKYIYKS